jgi:hypothetical protein
MKRLNENNHIIWDHNFTEAPVIATAVDSNVDMIQSAASVDADPFANDTSNYGFDYNSLEITLQANPAHPATYDPLTHIITIFSDPTWAVDSLQVLQYKWTDLAGNVSNVANVNIHVKPRPLGWRAHPPSYQCEVVGGDNTGNAFWSLLEAYWTDTGELAVPGGTTPNTPGIPEYVPPVVDQATCPLPSSTVPFYVYNFTDPGTNSLIKSIKLGSTGAVLTLNHARSAPQPRQVQVTPGAYDLLEVIVENIDPGALNSLALNSPGGGSDTQGVGTSAGLQTITFPTVTIATGFGGDLTLAP